MRLPHMLAISACLSFGIASTAPATPMFMGLGNLGTASGTTSDSISADGSTVVGRSFSPQGGRAFRWTFGGGMENLGDLPGGGDYSEADGVSSDGGVVVGTSHSYPGQEAFRWTATEGMIGLGILGGGGVYNSVGRGVSADGTVAVGYSSTSLGVEEAFRWTQQTGMVGLGDLGGSSIANATSADGSIVVGHSWTTGGSAQAFRWTVDEGMISLASGQSDASDITDDGLTIVGSLAAQPARWTQATGMIPLGPFPDGFDAGVARAVSADGSVIVGTYLGSVGQHAFIWDSLHGFRDLQEVLEGLHLDLSGWAYLEDAVGVSADGRTITGYGGGPSGGTEAWIATIPEPSTALLLACGLAGLAAARRRRSLQ